MRPFERFKKDIAGSILSAATALFLILSLTFYFPAIGNDFHAAFVVFCAAAVLLFALGTIFPLRGVYDVLGAGFSAFCLGFFLIGRLRLGFINFVSADYSSVDSWFYVETSFLSVALISALATSIIRKN